MSSRPFEPRSLEVAPFAAVNGFLQGCWPLASMQRLADLCHAAAAAGPAETVNWRVDGGMRKLGAYGLQAGLRLRLRTQLALTCQRCLAPLAVPLAIDRWFCFVDGESQAAQLDADSEDDILALTRSLDLHVLAEDELLLALPLVPRHEQCPNPLISTAINPVPETQTRQNPFVALVALKHRTPGE